MRQTINIFLVLLLIGCSNGKPNFPEQITQTQSSVFDLPDSLFAFHDITSSLFEKHLWCDKNDNYKLYSDSVRKFPLVELDTIQKRKIVAPVFISEMPMVDADYATHFLQAQFISKQKKIGDFLPIIVRVEGDDYAALFYILLDKTFTPVSHYRMSGGERGGPKYMGKLMELCPERQSFLKDKEIKSYSITEFIMPDSIPQLSIFDSINYVSKIFATGQIETKQIDSTRYEGISEQ